MGISKNKVFIIGNLGDTPEIKTAKNNNNEFASFSVATSDSYKDKEGNKKEHTEWHNIAVFKPHSVSYLKEYAKKGDLVLIEGSLTTKKWQDEKGKDHYSTQIIVRDYEHDFQIMKSNKEANQESEEIEEKPNKKTKKSATA